MKVENFWYLFHLKKCPSRFPLSWITTSELTRYHGHWEKRLADFLSRSCKMCKNSRENVVKKCFSLALQKAEEPSKKEVGCVERFTVNAGALSRDAVTLKSKRSLLKRADLPFIPYNLLPEEQMLSTKKQGMFVEFTSAYHFYLQKTIGVLIGEFSIYTKKPKFS